LVSFSADAARFGGRQRLALRQDQRMGCCQIGGQGIRATHRRIKAQVLAPSGALCCA
jgi:hypothetical protein